MTATDESHSLRGPTDRGALLDFRAVFERLEPLASGELDDFVDPRELHIQLADGVGDAESARLDVRWTTRADYTVHYTDSQSRNLRWDVHSHDYPRPSGDGHFHPPPDATNTPSEVEESCIEVTSVELVARAVHALWRDAYEQGAVDEINDAHDPP